VLGRGPAMYSIENVRFVLIMCRVLDHGPVM